jgi:hypothetical protein
MLQINDSQVINLRNLDLVETAGENAFFVMSSGKRWGGPIANMPESTRRLLVELLNQ